MQRLLRALVLITILLIVGGVVYTQTNFFSTLKHPVALAQTVLSKARQKVAEIAEIGKEEARPEPAPEPAPAAASAPGPVSSPTPKPSSAPGSEASPLVVKVLPAPPSPEQASERDKDREIQGRIERHLMSLAKTAQFEEYLLIFIAFLFVFALYLIAWLMEIVRKTAEAAARTAEAAKKSAETAEAAFKQKMDRHAARKFPPRFYRKR